MKNFLKTATILSASLAMTTTASAEREASVSFSVENEMIPVFAMEGAYEELTKEIYSISTNALDGGYKVTSGNLEGIYEILESGETDIESALLEASFEEAENLIMMYEGEEMNPEIAMLDYTITCSYSSATGQLTCTMTFEL